MTHKTWTETFEIRRFSNLHDLLKDIIRFREDSHATNFSPYDLSEKLCSGWVSVEHQICWETHITGLKESQHDLPKDIFGLVRSKEGRQTLGDLLREERVHLKRGILSKEEEDDG